MSPANDTDATSGRLNAQVVVVDDEPLIRDSLRRAFRAEGFEVSVASSLAEANERLAEGQPDVVVVDLMLGSDDGFDLLRRVRRDLPETKVLVMTSYGTIETAVAAMKLGSYDFIKKPFDLDEMLAAVRNAVHTSTLERRVDYLAQRERSRHETRALVWEDPRTRALVSEIDVIASNSVPMVLITGESGTGKQHVARLLHERSRRADGPFVELNCCAMPENLIESELFGHERGAFSGAHERKLGLVEVAEGGTLFLDEIGDLGLPAQAKLLTFIEQRAFRRLGSTTVRRVNVRIVAATNRNLAERVAAREFREDLYFRLSSFTVRVPPLRERVGDVIPLATYFLEACAHEYGRRWRSVSPEAAALLIRYPWPGNVRELRSVVSRAALMNDAVVLTPDHLPDELSSPFLAAGDGALTPLPAPPAEGEPAIPSLAEVELAHIRRTLDQLGGNRTLAAQRLGISRQTLAKKLGT
jgi:two-component system response regulator AtoC